MSVPVYHLLNVAVLIFGHFSEIFGHFSMQLQTPLLGKILKEVVNPLICKSVTSVNLLIR